MTRRTTIAPTTVIFDFDLTLVDSRPGFIASHRHAATLMGVPEPTEAAITSAIGVPIHEFIPKWYPQLTEAQVAEYIRVYRQKADEVMADLTTVLPHARETLEQLQQAGIKLGIVSQKLHPLIERVLDREDMKVDVLLGGEDLPAFKPDPRGLLLAMELLDVTPGACVYVGDTTIDAEAAANAGVPFIGVLTGVTTREDFASHASLTLLDHVGQLPEFLGL